MDKQCKKCGATVSGDAKFCRDCGGSEFIVPANGQGEQANDPNGYAYGQGEQVNNPNGYAYGQGEQANNPNGYAYGQGEQVNNPNGYAYGQPASGQNAPGYNQNPYDRQPVYPYAPQVPQKKKNHTALIIVIVVAVLAVLAVAGIVVAGIAQRPESNVDDNITDNYTHDIDDSEVADGTKPASANKDYTKGVFDGSVYTNEWADIKFVKPDGFSNADADTYSAAENDTTDCGVYYMADDTMSLVYICYEKLPTFPIYDESAYLDNVVSLLGQIDGITYKTPDSYKSETIGGHTYMKAECEFNNGYGDFANTFYVRKLGNYMICMSAISINSESNDALMHMITPIE